MKIKFFDIDYNIEFQDVYDLIEDDFTDDTSDEVAKKMARKKIKEIKSSLPKELILDINDVDYDGVKDDKYDLEDFLADQLSCETDWLINTFKYEIEG